MLSFFLLSFFSADDTFMELLLPPPPPPVPLADFTTRDVVATFTCASVIGFPVAMFVLFIGDFDMAGAIFELSPIFDGVAALPLPSGCRRWAGFITNDDDDVAAARLALCDRVTFVFEVDVVVGVVAVVAAFGNVADAGGSVYALCRK